MLPQRRRRRERERYSEMQMHACATTARSVLPREANVCCMNIATRAINIVDNDKRLPAGQVGAKATSIFRQSRRVADAWLIGEGWRNPRRRIRKARVVLARVGGGAMSSCGLNRL